MLITALPDMALAAAPLTQVLANTFNLATQTDADSLISYSAPARVEPITLIDGELVMFEDFAKLLSTTNNLFSCYYIAGATRSLNINSYRILRSIDHLKPNRSALGALGDFADSSMARTPGGGTVASNVESKLIGIATEGLSLPRFGASTMAVESRAGGNSRRDSKWLGRNPSEQEKREFNRIAAQQVEKAVKEQVEAEKKEMAVRAATITNSSIKKATMDYMEAPHLVTGKIFELSATYNGNTATVQVMVSLDAQVTRSQNLIDILALGGERRGMVETFHGWKSGRLRLLDDVIMCSDLIDAELRVGIHDETGSYLRNRENDTNNRLTALLTGKRSVGTASGIVIISARTARRLESAVNGLLDDYATRQKIFKRTFNMLMMVIDPERDRVVVYHRGLAKINRLPISEFIKARGKDGNDVTDIVKLFLSGSAPTL